MSKKNLLDRMANTDTGAPLVEQKATSQAKMRKQLNGLPVSYVDAHKKAKKDGLTGLDLSNYIYEALREKLQREGLM